MKAFINRKGRTPALRKILIWLLCLFGAVLLVGLFMLAASDMAVRQLQWDRSVRAARGQLGELEASLSETNMFLTDILTNNGQIKALRQETDIQRCNAAARKLGEDLAAHNRGRALRYSFYFYAEGCGVESFCYDGYSDYADCMKLKGRIREAAASGEQVKSGFVWEPVTVNGRVYLLQCYQLDGAAAAGWVPCSRAFSFLVNLGDYTARDRDGGLLVPGGGSGGSLWGELSEELSMRYGAVDITLTDRAGEYMGAHMVTICFFGLLLLVVAAFSIYTINYFQRYIQRPFEALQERVDCYSKERQNARRRGFAELDRAMEAFDSLSEQLNRLKIEQYEDRITLAKTQLEFFQLQIKPHFFVNAFSILHGMAQKRDYERIQEFCLKLSDYVRYLFRDGLSTAPLSDELKAVRGYLDVQDIRYRTHSVMNRSIAPECLSCQVPPVLLLTFVENAVKHAGGDLSRLEVSIAVNPILRDGERAVRLQVASSCSTFSEEDLEALNSGGAPAQSGSSPDGRRVGIENVRQRMSLMYGDQYSMKFFNHEGRSVVEIVLPEREAFSVAGSPRRGAPAGNHA